MRDYDETNVNRRYFLWYVGQVAAPGARVLDFGCGSGTVVRMLRKAGYEGYGVDINWPGADYGDLAEKELPKDTLRYYDEGGALPFEDAMFDVILSEQVFEHVVPMEATVRELERVLKPGGVMYHHFPSRTVLREGHIGVPLAHRLPAGRARLLYAAALRRLGAGNSANDGTDAPEPVEWARRNLQWVDDWTVYRPLGEVEAILGDRGVVGHREIDYCRFRAGDRPWLSWLLSRARMRRPAEWAFRRLAFEAFEVRSPGRGRP
jgi:SAM-dependent methyltransferase